MKNRLKAWLTLLIPRRGWSADPEVMAMQLWCRVYMETDAGPVLRASIANSAAISFSRSFKLFRFKNAV